MTNVRPNYFNLQTLDVSDVTQEHNYLNDKIIETLKNLGLDGVTQLDGLQVVEDSVVIESSPQPLVAHSSARPELANYLDFPYDEKFTESSRLYTVFKATSNNIERVDLKLQVLPVTYNSFVTISIVTLANPLEPTSALGESVLVRRIYKVNDLPLSEADAPLVIDLSGNNERQGVATTAGNYYAITIDFTRETASKDILRVFHSNKSETASIDPSLYSWIYFGTRFQQGLYNSQATFETFVVYHKVYAAAVKVMPGTVAIDGVPTRITEEQRYLGLVARGSDKPTNYVVVEFAEATAALESAARTGNKAVSRIQDSFKLTVLTETGLSDYVKEGKKFSILASVQDRNVLNFSTLQSITVKENSNLAYQDWLVPSNTQPSVIALSILEQRASDLVFIVDNVPSSVLLQDHQGTPILDGNGLVQSDKVTQVFIDLYLNGGVNKRSLLMTSVKETTSVPSYRTYAATLTDPTSTTLLDYTYPFNVDELNADTYFNFRAVTASGKQIFVQDFDKVVTVKNTTTDQYETLRDKTFEVSAEKGAVTLTINEDLRLGESSLSSGVAGQELVGYRSIYHNEEVPTSIGVSVNETIVPRTDTLQASNNYIFGPLPVVNRDGSTILNNTDSVTTAYNAGDMTLYINGVDVTFSGTTSKDKGGKGAPFTIFGELTSADKDDYIAKRVVFRNSDGKDNTQQRIQYLLKKDVGTGKVEFTAVALGKGNDSTAGFEVGEEVYIYIDDRPALDANNVPLTVPFNAYQATSIKIFSLGSKNYFTGKAIVAAGDRIVNSVVKPNDNEVAIDPLLGQVYFPVGEVPSGTITFQFLQLNSQVKKVDYYKLSTIPLGTSLKQPVANNDTAVSSAVSRGDITITVDGVNIRTGNFTLVGPAIVVADRQIAQLEDWQVSVNPIEGKIVFHSSFTTGTEPIIKDSSVVKVSYYNLIPVTISTVSQTFSGYDPRYDLNSDGRIDEEDVAIFQTAFGTAAGDPNFLPAADFNNDGVIDASDQTELMLHFGTSSSGLLNYSEATTMRLKTLFAYNKNTPSKRLEVVRAVSKAATSSEPGSTILFISTNTPVTELATYEVVFGYPNLLENIVNSFVVSTDANFVQPIDYGSISGRNKDNSTKTVQIFDSKTEVVNNNNSIVYNTTFYFNPPIRTSGTWLFESRWLGSHLAVFSRRKPLTPVEYEFLQRQIIGPFDIRLSENSFLQDGTAVELAIGARDSFYASGAPDVTGKHIRGLPIGDARYKVILRVPTTDGSYSYDEWVWNNLQVDSTTGFLRLSFNSSLQTDHRVKGLNGAVVLQPFGLASDQIILKPEYAGGYIKNDLSNLLVFRETSSPDVLPHSHGPNSGGTLNSDSVRIISSDICQAANANLSLTQALCEIRTIIQTNITIGDFGNEIVSVKGCTPLYGGTEPPIRIPTKVGDLCYSPCGPIVAVNPIWRNDPQGWGPHTSGGNQNSYYYNCCDDCCAIRIKVGAIGPDYFEVEYCVDGTQTVMLDFNWAACGQVIPCPTIPPPPPLVVGEVTMIQRCDFRFSATVSCGTGTTEPSYFWDLGDGIHTSTMREFDFHYDSPGTYHTSLVATCSDGRTFTDSLLVIAC